MPCLECIEYQMGGPLAEYNDMVCLKCPEGSNVELALNGDHFIGLEKCVVSAKCDDSNDKKV